MGSAGAKIAAVIRGEAEVYVHAGGQYEWDSAAPVAVALAMGLHATRLDGAPLRYSQPDPWLPDLVVCHPDLADAVMVALPTPASPGWGRRVGPVREGTESGMSAAAPTEVDGPAPEVFAPARLGPLTLKNRIIKSATFEGASPKGAITDDLVAFHRRMAAGGVAMTTVAYLAVSPEGRTDRHCVLLARRQGGRPQGAHRHRARGRRGGLGPDRPRRPGGQRPVQPGAVPGPDPPPQHRRGHHPGRDRPGHRPDHRGVPPGRLRSPSRPASTASRSTSATTTS